ncbi:hypothetical protein IP88_05290 [alpha proteobacterium AAP81b]|nr:hypothetical protein IP88_05290 [alpha proteobacterium AAP81b]
MLAAFFPAVLPAMTADAVAAAVAPGAPVAGEAAGAARDAAPVLVVTMSSSTTIIAFQREGPPPRPSFPIVVRQMEARLGAKFIGVQDDDEDVLRMRFIRQDGSVFNVDVDPATLMVIPASPTAPRRKNY